MKQCKCDRCGAVDDGSKIVGCGISEFYVGRVERYQYVEVPEFVGVDLCRGCNADLDGLVSAFMAGPPSNNSLERT